jgi:hypothetical protein
VVDPASHFQPLTSQRNLILVATQYFFWRTWREAFFALELPSWSALAIGRSRGNVFR